uniref:Cytidylate kinase n=1 Tax=Geoglobus ahangari TaxID=113653 RepID=A0A7C3UCA3_9EURY
MKITISGPPGSGTTTVARKLSERLEIPLISAGEIFRRLAMERGMTLEEFSKLAESDPEIDSLIDHKQKELSLQYDSGIFEGRLSGWMIDADLKVWIYCKADIRYGRIAKREKKPIEVVRAETKLREESERKRYLKIYGIDIDDLSVYHLAINSEKFNPDQIVEIILKTLELMK